jgi:hypothetical protein
LCSVVRRSNVRPTMRPRRRTLRELLADLRLPREDNPELRAEQCLETLFDSDRCACGSLGEREQAELEAERRRWATTHAGPPATG